MSENWPDHIPKPDLPDGYRWLGLKQLPAGSRWNIRVLWQIERGRQTFVKMPQVFFETPERAVEVAVETVRQHKLARG